MTSLALATLASAFLLFQVQPLIARAILPTFGGTPAVWTTCMLFFQTLLIGGYGYAHLMSKRPPRAQATIHSLVLIASVLLLVVDVALHGAPLLPETAAVGTSFPAFTILRLLAVSVGVPYLVLSTTGPLLQSWQARLSQGGSPYRLYALSNAGSLVGLLGYPLVIEPALTLKQQAFAWTGLYGVFVIATLVTAMRARGLAVEVVSAGVEANTPRPPARAYLTWGLFAFVSSTLLLATTNQLCEDVAAMPLLWVVPLSLYLVSFILAFDRPRWYARAVFMPLYFVAVVWALQLVPDMRARLIWQISAWALLLFCGCMICHGELARRKPEPKHLTGFYLSMAVGGALGGGLVGLVAPLVFRDYLEVDFALVGCAVVIVWVLAADLESPWHVGSAAATPVAIAAGVASVGWLVSKLYSQPAVIALGALGLGAWLALSARWRKPGQRFSSDDRLWVRAALPLVVVALTGLAFQTRQVSVANMRSVTRSFFGVLRVYDQFLDVPQESSRVLAHGRIVHGLQALSEADRRIPTAYYEVESGVGRAMKMHPRRAEGLRVGVCGLGAGTLAAYLQPADTARFYEIDADVIALSEGANPEFTFVHDAPGKVTMVLGDARVSLANELRGGAHKDFDVLAIDAFSGDAIPVHLLTREAVSLYLERLADDGVLALHLSNRHLNLVPVAKAIGRALGLSWVVVSHAPERPPHDYGWNSTWVLLGRSPEQMRAYEPSENDDDDTVVPPWTDEYSNIVRALDL